MNAFVPVWQSRALVVTWNESSEKYKNVLHYIHNYTFFKHFPYRNTQSSVSNTGFTEFFTRTSEHQLIRRVSCIY
jgi:hypothetical protein